MVVVEDETHITELTWHVLDVPSSDDVEFSLIDVNHRELQYSFSLWNPKGSYTSSHQTITPMLVVSPAYV